MHARMYARSNREIAHWESRLDSLVLRAEEQGKETQGRRLLLQRADRVRAKLRKLSY